MNVNLQFLSAGEVALVFFKGGWKTERYSLLPPVLPSLPSSQQGKETPEEAPIVPHL